ncbi:glycosyltransferase [Terrabacter sp. LjRoot27]|uniref:glycosyltransferase family 2 protein n=1 Tax=Terrabacter sp. LjRoot27 TaxID=3342306 RepID=UPI003ECFDFB2
MSVSVVVVGFGDEPVLSECLQSIRAQLENDDELILVDHGITEFQPCEGVTVVTPSGNSGFGGGCAAGVAASTGDVLAFVNSDAVLRPGAIAALAAAVGDPTVGLVGGIVLLPGMPETINSMGLPVHLSGLSWSDGYGEALGPSHRKLRQLTSVAGALFACRRDTWDLLGGMDPAYFMYHEDTDLSLRAHLAGLTVELCPEAFACHQYEFSRNSQKMFFLERNRFLTVLGDFPNHLLLRTLPALLMLEPLYVAIAIRDGWASEKVRAWWWLWQHRREVLARRRRVQSRVAAPHALDQLLTASITQTQLRPPVGFKLLNSALNSYWAIAQPDAETPHRSVTRTLDYGAEKGTGA